MTLNDYLALKNISRSQFQELIGAKPQSLARYLHGERIPEKETMVKIAEVTGGLVTANDFYGIANCKTKRGTQ